MNSLGSPDASRPRRLWVDTDIALGADRGDVDDGFALAAVLRAHQIGLATLEGISVVKGNTDVETAQRCAHRLVETSEAGTSGRDCGRAYVAGVATDRDAAEAIAALPSGTSVVALGPLTNVARALEIDPSLPERVDLRVVATVLDRRRHPILPWFCLNLRHDADAARVVMRSWSRNLRILPLDVVATMRVGRARLSELRSLEDPSGLGTYLESQSLRWLRQAPLRYQSLEFPVWDLVAALDALDCLSEPCWSGHSLAGFDADSGWRSFVALIGGHLPELHRVTTSEVV